MIRSNACLALLKKHLASRRHMHIQELWHSAADYLERNCFDDAVSAFREASLICEPSNMQLASLAIAEEQSCLDFRRRLCDRHSQSPTCKRSYLTSLRDAGLFEIAYREATDVIASHELSDLDECLFRLARLKISLLKRTESEVLEAVAATIAEDFRYVWNASIVDTRFCGLLNGVLKAVAECSHPQYSGVLVKISKFDGLDASYAHFLLRKSEELISLERALAGG